MFQLYFTREFNDLILRSSKYYVTFERRQKRIVASGFTNGDISFQVPHKLNRQIQSIQKIHIFLSREIKQKP
jgi:hypothetical protein